MKLKGQVGEDAFGGFKLHRVGCVDVSVGDFGHPTPEALNPKP